MKKLGLFLACCLSVSLGHALTLSQLKTELRRSLRDNPSDTARQRYSDSTLVDYLNEAQRDVVNTTWLLEKATGYALSPRTTYYTLPSDMLAVHKVYFTNRSNQTITLKEFSQSGLYDTMPAWELTGGNSPVNYWVSHTTYSSPSNPTGLRISYIPIPSANGTSTGTVTVWYYFQATDLATDSDIPFDARRVLYPYHMALVYHACMRLKLIEGKSDEAKDYSALYQSYLAVLKNRLGQMPGYNPGMAVSP